ncbi:MAG TPA: nuclear transport factor 2 family protein [Steroidobacteraceae bacterium]|nr:nuclear transport factor 2 family protein [Steroidobacteraceae bacterium]
MSARARPRYGHLLGAAAGTLLALAVHAQSSGPVSAPVPKATASHEPPIPPSNPPQTEAQRKAFAPGDKSPAAVVNAFNQMAFFDHDPVGAMKKYLADDFVERYPDFAKDEAGTDKEATIRFFETRGWKPGEQMQDVIYQVIADKDRAVVFHNTTRAPGDRGTAWVDIFRVKNGLIVEHWGVGQAVSEKVSPRHSMF